MRKKIGNRVLTVILLASMLVFTFTACDTTKNSSGNTSKDTVQSLSVEGISIHFIDVGQADCILIEQNDKYMMIDAGNNGDSELILDYLNKMGVKRLEYVIGTHPHEDHIGSLDKVIDNYEIGKVIMPKVTHTTKTYKDVLESIKKKNLKITSPSVGDSFELGDAKFTILAPMSNEYEDLNDNSIVLKLEYGENNFLFTGDAEKHSEEDMLENGSNLKSDVLKVGHHGSSTSTTEEFLEAVDPEYAVIMCETGNDYGHPHKETMDLLQKYNVEIYRTDKNGTIVLKSNGKNIVFESSRGSSEGSTTSENKDENVKDNQPEGIIISKVDKEKEVITLLNNSDKDMNLEGWKIVSVRGNQEFIFPKYTLKSGGKVTITSGDEKGDFNWGKSNVWNNAESDPAELYDNKGNIVFKIEN